MLWITALNDHPVSYIYLHLVILSNSTGPKKKTTVIVVLNSIYKLTCLVIMPYSKGFSSLHSSVLEIYGTSLTHNFCSNWAIIFIAIKLFLVVKIITCTSADYSAHPNL